MLVLSEEGIIQQKTVSPNKQGYRFLIAYFKYSEDNPSKSIRYVMENIDFSPVFSHNISVMIIAFE